jgi:hypothetical protein
MSGAALPGAPEDHRDGEPVPRVRGEPRRERGSAPRFAEQKRLQLKEEVQFFTDESKQRRVFSFKARQRLDVRAEHDVLDEQGRPIGWFRKEFGASLLRSTWTLAGPGLEARGQERRPVHRRAARVWTVLPYVGDVWVPFVFHFDFADAATGAPVLTSERRKAVRDRYDVTVHDPGWTSGWPRRWPWRWTRCRAADRARGRSSPGRVVLTSAALPTGTSWAPTG